MTHWVFAVSPEKQPRAVEGLLSADPDAEHSWYAKQRRLRMEPGDPVLYYVSAGLPDVGPWRGEMGAIAAVGEISSHSYEGQTDDPKKPWRVMVRVFSALTVPLTLPEIDRLLPPKPGGKRNELNQMIRSNNILRPERWRVLWEDILTRNPAQRSSLERWYAAHGG
jgi:hypothetical protein